MNETHKNSILSKVCCYECTHWKDQNANGIGTCTNCNSEYNGAAMNATDSCAQMKNNDATEYKYKIEICDKTADTIKPATYILQKTEQDAWETTKKLAIDMAENISQKEITNLTFHIEKPEIKITYDGLHSVTYRVQKREDIHERVAD